MKTFNRCDLIPAKDENGPIELVDRANKCGLKVMDILDVWINEEHYKELLLTGTRWSYIKYWGTALLKGEAELGAIPGVLKLMFM